jgi:hypothetical protein
MWGDPQVRRLENTDADGSIEAGKIRQRLTQELLVLMSSAKEELKQVWTNEQNAVLIRLRPAPLEKKATLRWEGGEALEVTHNLIVVRRIAWSGQVCRIHARW